jgi:hypothetical protein
VRLQAAAMFEQDQWRRWTAWGTTVLASNGLDGVACPPVASPAAPAQAARDEAAVGPRAECDLGQASRLVAAIRVYLCFEDKGGQTLPPAEDPLLCPAAAGHQRPRCPGRAPGMCHRRGMTRYRPVPATGSIGSACTEAQGRAPHHL